MTAFIFTVDREKLLVPGTFEVVFRDSAEKAAMDMILSMGISIEARHVPVEPGDGPYLSNDVEQDARLYNQLKIKEVGGKPCRGCGEYEFGSPAHRKCFLELCPGCRTARQCSTCCEHQDCELEIIG